MSLASKDAFPAETLAGMLDQSAFGLMVLAPILLILVIFVIGAMARSAKRMKEWEEIEPYMRESSPQPMSEVGTEFGDDVDDHDTPPKPPLKSAG